MNDWIGADSSSFLGLISLPAGCANALCRFRHLVGTWYVFAEHDFLPQMGDLMCPHDWGGGKPKEIGD